MDGDRQPTPRRRERPAEEKTEEGRGREAVRLLDFSTIGLVFPVALLLGFFGGRAIGVRLGAEAWGTWIGLALGFLAGFYNLFKVILSLQEKEPEPPHDGDGG